MEGIINKIIKIKEKEENAVKIKVCYNDESDKLINQLINNLENRPKFWSVENVSHSKTGISFINHDSYQDISFDKYIEIKLYPNMDIIDINKLVKDTLLCNLMSNSYNADTVMVQHNKENILFDRINGIKYLKKLNTKGELKNDKKVINEFELKFDVISEYNDDEFLDEAVRDSLITAKSMIDSPILNIEIIDRKQKRMKSMTKRNAPILMMKYTYTVKVKQKDLQNGNRAIDVIQCGLKEDLIDKIPNTLYTIHRKGNKIWKLK